MFKGFTSRGRLRPGYVSDLLEQNMLRRLYVSESYSACAIVTDGVMGVPYLCKFAVTEQAIGQGTADNLWAQIKADYPELYWRSHTQSHDINTWFFERAEGMRRAHGGAVGEEDQDLDEHPPWTVFWYGLDDREREDAVFESACSKPRSYFEAEDE